MGNKPINSSNESDVEVVIGGYFMSITSKGKGILESLVLFIYSILYANETNRRMRLRGNEKLEWPVSQIPQNAERRYQTIRRDIFTTKTRNGFEHANKENWTKKSSWSSGKGISTIVKKKIRYTKVWNALNYSKFTQKFHCARYARMKFFNQYAIHAISCESSSILFRKNSVASHVIGMAFTFHLLSSYLSSLSDHLFMLITLCVPSLDGEGNGRAESS